VVEEPKKADLDAIDPRPVLKQTGNRKYHCDDSSMGRKHELGCSEKQHHNEEGQGRRVSPVLVVVGVLFMRRQYELPNPEFWSLFLLYVSFCCCCCVKQVSIDAVRGRICYTAECVRKVFFVCCFLLFVCLFVLFDMLCSLFFNEGSFSSFLWPRQK